jgi:hypothetical protein
MMLTTTTNNINTNISNTAQQRKKRTPEEQEERQRDCLWNRVNGALFKRMKRNLLAANALFGTPEWVEPDMRFFTASEEREVTRHAALVEECLDEASAHAKRKGWRPIPSSICQAASSGPRRWSPT